MWVIARGYQTENPSSGFGCLQLLGSARSVDFAEGTDCTPHYSKRPSGGKDVLATLCVKLSQKEVPLWSSRVQVSVPFQRLYQLCTLDLQRKDLKRAPSSIHISCMSPMCTRITWSPGCVDARKGLQVRWSIFGRSLSVLVRTWALRLRRLEFQISHEQRLERFMARLLPARGLVLTCV